MLGFWFVWMTFIFINMIKIKKFLKNIKIYTIFLLENNSDNLLQKKEDLGEYKFANIINSTENAT